MTIAPIYVPAPAYNHPVELELLHRLRTQGEALVLRYIETNSRAGTCFVSRDAAKRLFPEFVAEATLHNRHSDGAASAIADAARRTLLSRPVQLPRSWVMIFTGAPASGKTRSSAPNRSEQIEVLHETIFTSLQRAAELIEQALAARRVPVHLFYADDPAINLRRMVNRARSIGRTVPIDYMAKTYVDVPRVVAMLAQQFGKSLELRVTNNSEARSWAVDHNRIERALYHVNRYTYHSALEAMHAELDKIIGESEGLPQSILDEALRV